MKSDSLQAEKSAIEIRPGSAVEEKPHGRHTQVIIEVIPMTPFLKNLTSDLLMNQLAFPSQKYLRNIQF